MQDINETNTTQTQDVNETNTAQIQDMNETASRKKNTERKKKRPFSPRRSRLYIALGASLGAVLLLYILIGFHYKSVFFPATVVNGIDISGLTPMQVQELLKTNTAEYILTIIEDGDNTEQISGSSIGLSAKDMDCLQEIVDNQDFLTWAFQSFQEKDYLLDLEYDEEKLFSAISELSCLDKKSWISPKNAYIEYEMGSGYKIVPEIPGTQILIDNLYEAVTAAVDHLDSELSLRDAGVYRLPEITSDTASLTEQFAKLEPYSDMTVTYQFDSQTEILDSDTLSEWISLDARGNIEIDEEAAAEFVKSLAKKYNTAYTPKTLETSYGETITIKGGFYGWQIDRAAETENLMEIIRNGKSVTREPEYLLSAASHGETDYGDTYVEINLTAQHLFYYKDGELLIESDFVSGNPSQGNATPAGAYAITYTERNATLKGQNYSTPVSYWMPFNGNIGMHDSTWRSSYGGVIYQTNGSHGCINLPPAVAKTIFENIEKGVPVLCYHLGGTQQAPSTPSNEQTADEIDPAQELGEDGVPIDTQIPPGEEITTEIPSVSPEDGNPVVVPPASPEDGNPAEIPPASPESGNPAEVAPAPSETDNPAVVTPAPPTTENPVEIPPAPSETENPETLLSAPAQ